MRAEALLIGILMLSASLAGCFKEDTSPPPPEGPSLPGGIFLTGPDGLNLSLDLYQPLPLSFVFSNVGEDGAEPSIGITSSGCMFFTAFEKVMRSCDHGESWEHMNSIFQHPSTSDPWLWVDPVTDRVFDVQMVGLLTTWIAWSDDDGVNWLGNPHDSGPIPLNDHIKLGTGPWTDDGYGIPGQMDPIYEQAVYFCYNKGIGIFCYTSFDGGASFEVGGLVFGLATANGGLHGAITTAPDGTVYVTPRVETPTIVISKDNGLTWEERTMGEDVGTPNPRKNSEVATDSESNAYHIWVGSDFGVYMSRSTDSGQSWEQTSTRVSPIEVISTTFPHIDAGDPGRIAITYLGSENASELGLPDIDEVAWNGNPHYATGNVSYYLYITYSLNALDPDPVFHTVRVSPDPVQIGSICLNSGDCRTIGESSNRNLLDFNDLHIDREGRVYVAFADGCTGACATDNNSTPEDSRSRLGSVYFLGSGPSLYESVELLAEFE
ncbi:MAG: sialidase family protein [Candidatus Thermoplasmatota archaeon]|uniref:Exo-alpha-sialidase n=1 Tax=marine metagenome TaxID=408172 RepID=A0A381Y4I0_9ZZZZ|nr:sialidase family protein [Candidatus Thermoplasmatota archaeon]